MKINENAHKYYEKYANTVIIKKTIYSIKYL